MYIVQSLLTKYIGRSHVATIDLEAASPEEFDREMAALDVVEAPVNLRDLAVIKVVPALRERIHRICRVVPEARAAEMV
jgi:hypothetical protein